METLRQEDTDQQVVVVNIATSRKAKWTQEESKEIVLSAECLLERNHVEPNGKKNGGRRRNRRGRGR